MKEDLYINRGRFGNHPSDVIGYTFDADTYCPDCTARAFPNDWTSAGWISEDARDSESNPINPIFAGSEFDYPAHCSDCRELLDGISLTPEGSEYVKESILSAISEGSRGAVVSEWSDTFGECLDLSDDVFITFFNLPSREDQKS